MSNQSSREKSASFFISQLIKQIEKHGFPEKKVAFPLERLYAKAHQYGVNLNVVLDFMKEKGYDHYKTAEKIIFYESSDHMGREDEQETSDGNMWQDPMKMLEGLGGDTFRNLNLGEIVSEASKIIKKMSPSQLAELQKHVEAMDEENKAKIIKKAKDLGLL